MKTVRFSSQALQACWLVACQTLQGRSLVARPRYQVHNARGQGVRGGVSCSEATQTCQWRRYEGQRGSCGFTPFAVGYDREHHTGISSLPAEGAAKLRAAVGGEASAGLPRHCWTRSPDKADIGDTSMIGHSPPAGKLRLVFLFSDFYYYFFKS